MYEEDVEICKEFIHSKPWRKNEEQFSKWETFLRRLCDSYGVTSPTLRINEKVKTPCYNRILNIISLTRFSVISFLHEFGHVIGLEESDCKEYSEKVFFTAYPKAKSYLKRDKRGYMVKNQEEVK